MKRKTKELRVIYKESEDINSEESKRMVSEAYDILFDEVLRQRRIKKSHIINNSRYIS